MSLCEWLVWGDAYTVALHKELVPFARVMPAHVERVEGVGQGVARCRPGPARAQSVPRGERYGISRERSAWSRRAILDPAASVCRQPSRWQDGCQRLVAKRLLAWTCGWYRARVSSLVVGVVGRAGRAGAC
ncbi:MAG: hypothetical protein ACRDZ4_00235 [Egibacteraceae bacterium]